MKKKIIFGIILGIIILGANCRAQRSDPNEPASPIIDDTVMLAADSLEIIQVSENKFFVVCTTCEVLTNHGYMQRRIVDSLLYISADIPKDYWLEAFETKRVTYKHQRLFSRLEIRNWKPVINYAWQDSEAIYSNDSLNSIRTSYSSYYDSSSLLSTQFSAYYLLLFTCILGFVWHIFSLGSGLSKSFHCFLGIILGMSIATMSYFTFGETLAAFTLPLITFTVGVFIPPLIINLTKSLIRLAKKIRS